MRRLGQHFLNDAGALKKIAVALEPRRGETIVEIGPGHGELTLALGDRLQVLGFRDEKIIAIEKDVELARMLREEFANNKHIEIVCGDALKLLQPITQNLTPNTYVLTGNIPYYITGYLLRVIQELEHKPRQTVLTIQSEVAERIVAKPPHMTHSTDSASSPQAGSGSSRASRGMNKLAAAVQFWAKPKIVARVPRTAFVPIPHIDSAVIVLVTRTNPLPISPERYFSALHAIFKQPRKTVLNNLAEAYNNPPGTKNRIQEVLQSLGIPPEARPQDLSLENIIALAERLDPAPAGEQFSHF